MNQPSLNHRAAVECIVVCCRMMAQHDLDECMRKIDEAEALGPILDPTLYREKSGAMRYDKELIESAMPLWQKARELK